MMRFTGKALKPRPRNGLGMYPDDACYDPDRPDLLPYWFDDSTESACKFKTQSITGQMVGAAGEMGTAAGQTLGTLVGSAVSGAVSGGTGIPTNYVPWLIGGAALLGLMVVVPTFLGGRR